MNTSSIDPSPFCIATGGVRIRVLAHPGARRDAVEGLRAQADGGTALRVAVRAAPEDGKANAAITALLAREWRVPKHSLRLVSGGADRHKSFHLSGEQGAARPTRFLAETTSGTIMSNIIDGKAFAEGLRGRIAKQIADLKSRHDIVPGLAVVLVGEDPASQVYVRNKAKQTVEIGMASFEHKLSKETSQAELLALVNKLNADPRVNGILVQLPLPRQISPQAVLDAIDPAKDVDGFHVVNAGRLATGGEAMVPCTPLGCLMLLKDRLGDLSGKRAIVLGRSNIVGKPMAQLLLGESCTVTIAHSRTRDLPGETRRAEIVVAAVGKPEMVRGDWIAPGATVIDVGINRIERDGKPKLVGDVAYDEAAKHAGAITPVPGGVGPMTIACLLQNTLTAALRQQGIKPS